MARYPCVERETRTLSGPALIAPISHSINEQRYPESVIQMIPFRKILFARRAGRLANDLCVATNFSTSRSLQLYLRSPAPGAVDDRFELADSGPCMLCLSPSIALIFMTPTGRSSSPEKT